MLLECYTDAVFFLCENYEKQKHTSDNQYVSKTGKTKQFFLSRMPC